MAVTRAERVAKFAATDIYPVTCEVLSAGRTDLEILRQVAHGGAKVIQLRDKTSSRRGLYKKAAAFRELTAELGMLLIINDYVDIALAVDADGVHLGQGDLPIEVARQLAPEQIIGSSCHSLPDIHEAMRLGADYTNLGPVFATQTKDTPVVPLGLDLVREAHAKFSHPVTVMGGIKLHHVSDLAAAGARHLAVVTAVTQADDIAAETAVWRNAIQTAMAG
ncbi:MAG TPA: thiamine phosphate synthase [Lentisphaeria bacterium]|jgi:thiamine-phosphate pyrophosphorylase|nr:thiamine phosphate synthase [Lentisphaeria bacterium]